MCVCKWVCLLTKREFRELLLFLRRHRFHSLGRKSSTFDVFEMPERQKEEKKSNGVSPIRADKRKLFSATFSPSSLWRHCALRAPQWTTHKHTIAGSREEEKKYNWMSEFIRKTADYIYIVRIFLFMYSDIGRSLRTEFVVGIGLCPCCAELYCVRNLYINTY